MARQKIVRRKCKRCKEIFIEDINHIRICSNCSKRGIRAGTKLPISTNNY